MKNLKSDAIAKLRCRWFEDSSYRKLVNTWSHLYDEHRRPFLKKNQYALEQSANSNVYNWLANTSRDMYIGLMPINEDYFGWIPKHYNEQFGREMLDFRGFKHDEMRYDHSMTFINYADFSYVERRMLQSFMYSTLIGCVFLNADLRHHLWGNYYNKCLFKDCNLSEYLISKTYIESCEFIRCKMTNPQEFRAHLKNTVFNGCSFRGAFFAYSVFINCKFKNCSMVKVDMETSKYINCIFEDCDWTNARTLPKNEECLVNEIDPRILKP